ncbi:uncharacterized protein LOC125943996 isoform X2 [Dermacentor silvarum]|nr:uncharacterized protein LOC125943996 isoform X2 [Dermacentor silvarum]
MKTNRSIALDDFGSDKCFIAGVGVVDTSGTITPIDIWIHNGIAMQQACASARTLLLMQLTNSLVGAKQQQKMKNGWNVVVLKEPKDMKKLYVRVYSNGTLVDVTVDDDMGLLYHGVKMPTFVVSFYDDLPQVAGETLTVQLSQGYGYVLARKKHKPIANVMMRTKRGLPTVVSIANSDTKKDDDMNKGRRGQKRPKSLMGVDDSCHDEEQQSTSKPTTSETNTTDFKERHSSAFTNGINETVRQAFAAVCPPDKQFDWLREQTLPEFFNAYLNSVVPYRADVYCPQLAVMVEYNGSFHYRKAYMERTVNDIMKRRYCRKNNIVQINVNPTLSHTQAGMQRYARFRLYTEVVGVEPIPSKKECAWFLGNDMLHDIVQDNNPHRGFSERELSYLEIEVSRLLPDMFVGEGRKIKFEPLFKILPHGSEKEPKQGDTTTNDASDYAAFTLRYNQSPFIAVDTRSNMEIKPANTKNVVYIIFWKRYPRCKYLFYRRDAIHVPLYLIKTLNKLIEYLACRIFDQVDEATLHWKKSTDPNGNQHCLVNKYGKY